MKTDRMRGGRRQSVEGWAMRHSGSLVRGGGLLGDVVAGHRGRGGVARRQRHRRGAGSKRGQRGRVAEGGEEAEVGGHQGRCVIAGPK
jgi:hypothetical protein